MDLRFQAVCEEAAERFEVPALAVFSAAAGDEMGVTVGCDAGARFRIASVTKVFTALLALGVLDPQDGTGVWPPDVRIGHLLSHTSGFDCELPERDLSRLGTGDDALAAAVAELPSVRRYLPVEQVFSYANTGYWLAAHLAAARLDATYEEAVAERILRPFGLEATSFGEPDLQGTGPDADEGRYPRARRPSGGLVASVGDVATFGRRLLDEPRFRTMRVPHARPVGGVYGFGLAGERVGGVEVWGHRGSYGGFQSSLVVVPERDAVFAGLTSSGTGSKALVEIEDAFFAAVVGARRREATFVELRPELLASYAGGYENGNERYDVRVDGEGLAVAFEDDDYPARPVSDRTFQLDGGTVLDRFDFPRPGFARFGGRLAERVA